MKKVTQLIFLLTTCLSLVSCSARPYKYGSLFVNGGFEYKASDPTTPAKWIIHSGNLKLDSVMKFSGDYAGRFTRDSSHTTLPAGLVYIAQSANKFYNKSLQLKAKIKYELSDTSSSASIFLQQIASDGVDRLSYGERLKGKGEWTELSVSLKIDSLSSSFFGFGVELAGQGAIWIDDIELYSDGHLVGYNPRKTPLNENEKTWLSKNTFDVNGKEFIASIGNARVVGIGEETHGSHSIRSTRWDIVKHLIKNEGFTVVMPEAVSYISEWADDLNVFIRHESDIKPRSYSFVDDSFVEWVREYNETTLNKVQFMGVEIWSILEVLERINRDSQGELAPQIDELKKCFKGKMVRDTVISTITICEKWADENIENLNERDNFKYNANLVVDYLNMNSEKRDEVMANNIERVAKQSPDGKIIFLAHNEHVKNGVHNHTLEKRAGAFLRERFGEDYYVIGMTFNEGEYKASKDVSKVWQSDINKTNPSMPGSYEYMLNSINNPSFFLPLRGVKSVKGENDWLFNQMEFRSVGLVYSAYEYGSYNWTDIFDAMIFLKESTVN